MMRRVISATFLSSMLLTAATLAIGTPAAAQSVRVDQPPLPLAEALDRIAAATRTTIIYDPDAVDGLTARRVTRAAGAEAAVAQAIRDRPLTVVVEDGRLMVVNDIVVRARRDEAETNLLVRRATTSSRTGESMRDQPRNAQVISSKLMEEQQSLTVADALRNAGGVSVNTASVQSGATFSVRGFGASGIQNGLPSVGVAAGATQPIASIERIEVLKGPDAILVGTDNLGGTINIVTKKPSSDPLLSLEGQTGSFGLRRFVLDANNALEDSKKLSARVIASASGADRNWGGYRGDHDWLFSPSLRFKDESTDVFVTATVGEQSFGMTPFAVIDQRTGGFYDLDYSSPLFIERNQGIDIATTQFYGEATHKPTSWLTLVARGQHQKQTLDIAQYGPYGVVDPAAGLMFIGLSRLGQQADSNAVDTYARFDFRTGPFTHRLIGGFTYTNSNTDYFSSATPGNPIYGFLNPTSPPPPLPAGAATLDLQLDATQRGFYGQYLVKFWDIALLAGVRNNRTISTANSIFTNRMTTERVNFTVPNFGAVWNVTPNISLFATLAEGYIPVVQVGRNGNPLPDTETRNIEAGVKLDFFRDRMVVNASWFRVRQSNLIISDPVDFLFPIAVPGQQGEGLDINVSGEIVKGWQVNGAFTRTTYRYLAPTEFLTTVAAQPRDQYSLYTSYRRPLGAVTLGGGAGLFGRSSAAIDPMGNFLSPAARQVDLNGFLEYRSLSLNLSVRNVFDRTNYGISYQTSFVPISEPRLWRLSLSYRFK